MARGMAEPEQRHGRHDSGAYEQDRQSWTDVTEGELAANSEKRQIKNRQRNDGHCFEKQSGNRSGAGFFAKKSVKAKRGAERERDPRKISVAECEIEDPDRGQQDRQALRTREM